MSLYTEANQLPDPELDYDGLEFDRAWKAIVYHICDFWSSQLGWDKDQELRRLYDTLDPFQHDNFYVNDLWHQSRTNDREQATAFFRVYIRRPFLRELYEMD